MHDIEYYKSSGYSKMIHKWLKEGMETLNSDDLTHFVAGRHFRKGHVLLLPKDWANEILYNVTKYTDIVPEIFHEEITLEPAEGYREIAIQFEYKSAPGRAWIDSFPQQLCYSVIDAVTEMHGVLGLSDQIYIDRQEIMGSNNTRHTIYLRIHKKKFLFQ